MSEIIINGLKLEQLAEKLSRVEDSSQQVESLVNQVVRQYCQPLDDFINNVYRLLSNKEVDVPDVDIEYMIMQLPCLMYFTSNKLEDLGVREDVARGFEKEVYSTALMSAEGRVSEKESVAQMASQRDALITSIHSRAYRKVKARIEFATETLGSLKKVLANRIANKELSSKDK